MKVLFVRLGAIGDVVHTLPALATLRQTYPSWHLAWAVERGPAAGLLVDNPYLDEVIELDFRSGSRDAASAPWRNAAIADIRKLREKEYDISLDFQGLLKSAMIPYFAGIPRRLGFAFSSLREPLSGVLLTQRVPASDQDHVIRKNLALVGALGCDTSQGYGFPIQTTPDDERFVADVVAASAAPFALLNPGGGWPTKLWNCQRFAELADLLWTDRGLASIITYGPGEESLAERIRASCRTAPARVLKTSLRQFFRLAREATLFIGGDTGPMHLAAAAGTPIVALFGPTSARRNGPFRAEDVVVARNDLECRTDCYRRRCEHSSCMDIPTESVWNAIVKRLEAYEGMADDAATHSPTWSSGVERGLIENV